MHGREVSTMEAGEKRAKRTVSPIVLLFFLSLVKSIFSFSVMQFLVFSFYAHYRAKINFKKTLLDCDVTSKNSLFSYVIVNFFFFSSSAHKHAP